MATQVLQPQDCLTERFRASPATSSRRGNNCRSYYYNNNNHAAAARSSSSSSSSYYRKQVTRPDQKKRVHVSSGQLEQSNCGTVSKRSSSDDSKVGRSNGLGSEKVTILRRGKSLDSAPVKSDIMYAGSACAMSPAPSALPLPSFSTRKQSPAAFDDSATRDLRRLLRLE
uniref:Uncharacterized protein n=1 Tax=Lotus japonicus TaxID=34305 RepID=I3SDQ4_LOTJA|nr:unknown [Lotus japonicus]